MALLQTIHDFLALSSVPYLINLDVQQCQLHSVLQTPRRSTRHIRQFDDIVIVVESYLNLALPANGLLQAAYIPTNKPLQRSGP